LPGATHNLCFVFYQNIYHLFIIIYLLLSLFIIIYLLLLSFTFKKRYWCVI